MKINLKLSGDHLDGKFTLYSCEIERKGYSVNILLSAEQMNAAAEYDDPFEAVLELQNIMTDSGFTILQTVNVENGDGSIEELEFVDAFDGITHEPWEEHTPIEINITDYGNIELVSAGGYEFMINTEPDDLKPTEIVDNLKSIFNQK